MVCGTAKKLWSSGQRAIGLDFVTLHPLSGFVSAAV